MLKFKCSILYNPSVFKKANFGIKVNALLNKNFSYFWCCFFGFEYIFAWKRKGKGFGSCSTLFHLQKKHFLFFSLPILRIHLRREQFFKA